MPNTFIEFLKQYTDLTATPQEPEQKSANEQNNRYEIITNSHRVIQESKVQGFSKIGRVFNDFPLEFASPDGQHFQAIEPHFIENWLNKLFTFLTSTTLNLVMEEVVLTTSTGNVSKNLSQCDIDNKQSKKNLYSLLNEIISKASDDLLDENGQLQDSIIQLLNLQDIIKQYEGQTKSLENIKLQVIASYCVQIVIGNILNPLTEKASKELTDRNKAEQFELNLGFLTKFIQDQILMSHTVQKDSKGDEYIYHSFSKYFKDSIALSVLNRFNKTPIHEQCAAELIKLHPDKIKKIIAADFKKAELTQQQLSGNPALRTKTSATLPIHKIHFWIDVLNFCCQQNNTYSSLMLAIKDYLSEQIKPEVNLKNPVYFSRYTECLLNIKQKNPLHAEQKEEFQNQPAESQLAKLLNAHTNIFLIDSIQKRTSRFSTLRPANKKAFKTLAKYKSKPDVIQASPVLVISTLHEIMKSSKEFEPILLQYQTALEHVDLFEQADTDITIPPNLSEQLNEPSALAEYKTPNRIIDSDITMLDALFKKMNRLSYSILSDTINEQLVELKQLRESNDDVADLSKKYNSNLTIMINELLTTIHHKYIENNLSYILANETMCRVYDEYDLLVRFIKTELSRLDHSTQKWRRALDYFCKHFITHVAHFKKFAEVIKTFKRPAEVGLTEKSKTEEKPEHSAIEIESQIRAIVADNELLEMAIQATHKSQGDCKNYNPLPNRSLRAEINRKTLESTFPYDHEKIRANIENIDFYLSNEQYNEAIPLMNSLPSSVAQHIFDYCTVSYDTIQHAILLASSARAEVQKDATIHITENDLERKLDSPVDQNSMFILHETVLNIFKLKAKNLTNLKHKDNLENAIQTLKQFATNPAEYIVMLAAEKEALHSGKRSNVLNECIIKAKTICPTHPVVDANRYLTAKKLLAYVNDCQSKTFQFSSRDFEIDQARSIARLMIQLSLIIKNPSVRNETVKSKQREILTALENVCFREKTDPQLLKLLNPVLADMQAIFQENCLPDIRYRHPGS